MTPPSRYPGYALALAYEQWPNLICEACRQGQHRHKPISQDHNCRKNKVRSAE
ncbi:hypothetical protein CCHR01_11459 [Colletotrichum chrysophilum]|uniref:Uncharacterized protein n=1 Tax=Colletotrichum chrysophilum TaxID=1836956 RepID=A0AAD9EIC5_9PEZI|nr:hypothetical protein CCHR01_11459 [Colletotrichum chrysophilum]